MRTYSALCLADEEQRAVSQRDTTILAILLDVAVVVIIHPATSTPSLLRPGTGNRSFHGAVGPGVHDVVIMSRRVLFLAMSQTCPAASEQEGAKEAEWGSDQGPRPGGHHAF